MTDINEIWSKEHNITVYNVTTTTPQSYIESSHNKLAPFPKDLMEIAEQKMEAKLDGTQEAEVVAWASAGWFSDPAQKAMTDFITSLGPNGFD